jgi:CheY-like chemotaxis protein
MERVLVVEDDPSVSELMEEALRGLGLEPSCVGTDLEAYSILPIQPPFRALVVDVNLGQGTTGFDVARFARQVIPEIPVVYVTGAVTEDSFRAFGVPGSIFIAKPFLPGELTEALRSLVSKAED